jgi:hypothetical protein
MITKGFTPENGAKVFAIMKTPSREALRGPARPDAGIKPHSQGSANAAKSPYFETLT